MRTTLFVAALAVVAASCGKTPPAPPAPPAPAAAAVPAPAPAPATSAATEELTKLAVSLEADADIGKDRLEAYRAAARAWGAVLRVDTKSSTAADALRRIAAKPEVAARRAELERAIVEAAAAGNSSAAALLLAELREWEPGAADFKALPETGIVARPAGRAGE